MKSQSSINKGIIEIIKVKIKIMLSLTLQSSKIHGIFYIVIIIRANYPIAIKLLK